MKLPFVKRNDYDSMEERNTELLKRISVVRYEKYKESIELNKEIRFNEELMETNDFLSFEVFKYKCGLPVMLFIGCAIGYFLR